jgi:hypothetical protein
VEISDCLIPVDAEKNAAEEHIDFHEVGRTCYVEKKLNLSKYESYLFFITLGFLSP